ncbi:MAG: hypothetical protein ACKO0Z_15745 [Betaproteobacteria bacterium]
MKHLSFIPKARAAYEAKAAALEKRRASAESKFLEAAEGALLADLYRRFKYGNWCAVWANRWDGGEITPALDLLDDAENAVPLSAKPDGYTFPHIALWGGLNTERLEWYLLKEQDVLVAHNHASELLVVFPPEQLDLIEKFFTNKRFTLYKKCL